MTLRMLCSRLFCLYLAMATVGCLPVQNAELPPQQTAEVGAPGATATPGASSGGDDDTTRGDDDTTRGDDDASGDDDATALPASPTPVGDDDTSPAGSTPVGDDDASPGASPPVGDDDVSWPGSPTPVGDDDASPVGDDDVGAGDDDMTWPDSSPPAEDGGATPSPPAAGGDDDASPVGDDDASPVGDDDVSPVGDDDVSWPATPTPDDGGGSTSSPADPGDDDATFGDDDVTGVVTPTGDSTPTLEPGTPADGDDTAGDVTPTLSVDADGDGYTPGGGDCDDDNAYVNPGTTEICDGIDDDCDGLEDEGFDTIVVYEDLDGDEFGNSDADALACDVFFGYVTNALDCDDSDATINPDTIEICNGIDDNCDDQVDEELTATYHPDQDGDGYGATDTSAELCSPQSGYVTNDLDCDDTNVDMYPSAPETFGDGVDSDCDGASDEISLVAGDGTPDWSGDGGDATVAGLQSPAGVAVDIDGSIYIADSANHCIRRVDALGIITTVAGTGTAGYGGDGGPATSALLNTPLDVGVDAAGILYIADSENHRIRKVDAQGTISTVAGNGTKGNGASGEVATKSKLNTPGGVGIDAEDLVYIADTGNHRIRRIESDGTMTVVAGTGQHGYIEDGVLATSTKLDSPYDVTPNGSEFYIADSKNDRIRRVDTAGYIYTVAGDGTAAFAGDGGPATAASLNVPTAVAFDASGNLFIADSTNHRIRRVDAGQIILTVAGTGVAGYSGDGGPSTSASLDTPWGVAIDDAGDLFIDDRGNHRTRKVTW